MSGELRGLGVEHVDEGGADGLALELGVADAGELAQEQRAGVDVDQRDVEVAAEQVDHLLGLAEAEQAGVDEDAGELVADGLVEEQGGDGGIDAAGEAADHAAVADLGADAGDRLLAVGVHRPVAGEAGDAEQEVLQEAGADRGVDDLGVELDAVEAAGLVGDGGEGRGVALGDDREARRDGGDAVAVAHPDGRALAGGEEAVEQGRGPVEADLGAAILALGRGLDPAAELGAHGLLAVADAEHRHAELEHGRGCARARAPRGSRRGRRRG